MFDATDDADEQAVTFSVPTSTADEAEANRRADKEGAL